MAGIGVLKSVKGAVYGIKCNDLCNDTIKIIEIHFLHNKEKRNEKNFLESITKIRNVLKVWRMRRLTLESKIIVFKTWEISKIVFLSLMSKVPAEIISELKRIQKSFLWPSKTNIKNEIISFDFKHGGLKNVNIQKKNNRSSMLLGEKIVWRFFPWMESNTVETYKKILWITF